MNWCAWTLIALFTVSSLLSIAQIGKPRVPLEPQVVVGIVIGNALASLLVIGAGR